MKIAIPQEYTSLGMKLEFSGIVWSQVRPAGAPKGAEKSIIRLCPKQAIKECVIINDFRRKSVNDKNISKKKLHPRIFMEQMHEQEVRAPLQQCGDVSSLQNHSVGEHGDTTHDVLYLCT